ncbi:MAG: hypothetical protein R3330_15710, partial [Saprospiraceae bacterium]|nr:hypothetical protein [Saprospiraceae bacterium]
IFSVGVEPADLPGSEDLRRLLAEPVEMRIDTDTGQPKDPCPWVVLAVPLNIGGRSIGVWLLGRRDPDDFYPTWIITDLQLISHQTAIALSNIIQTEQLHEFYQSDIDRQEAARARFAHWLHDDVLSELSALQMNVHETGPTDDFDEIWQRLVDEIRTMISGIRPVMLTYSLGDAIIELGDNINIETGNKTNVQVQISESAYRYGERVEGHLFRIVQEACRNSLKHADASLIKILGDLAPTHIDLLVEDDGCGFEAGQDMDMASLLKNRHYGLVTMHERASLIGADIQIRSNLGEGSQVHIFYEHPDQQDAKW